MSDYPVVLLPSSIAQVSDALPKLDLPPAPTQPKPPKPPKAPGIAPRRVEWGAIAPAVGVVGMLGLVLSFLSFASSPGLGVFLLLLTAIVVGGGCFSYGSVQRASYHQRLMGWENYKNQYPRLLQAHEAEISNLQQCYQRAMSDYEQQCERLKAEAHSPQNVQAFRAGQLASILKQTTSFDGNGSNAQRGRHESKLRNCLSEYFPGKIHDDLYLTIPGFDHPYSPDIAYIDDTTNLHIDIEVDEPYTYTTREPHHCIGSDDKRNRFFLDRYWLVIRFSEEQVVCHTQSCCKVVAQTIAKVTGDDKILYGFRSVRDLPKMPGWTYDQALEMEKRNIRQKYQC